MRTCFLLLISVFLLSCEDVHDKEERYKKELNTEFYSKFPNSLKEIFLSEKKSRYNCDLSINSSKIICPIQKGMDENYKRNIKIDHYFSKELIKNGFNLSYDLNEVDYLIFTENDYEKVGVYVDEDGNKTEDASIVYNSLYIYDLKSNKLCFIISHKGSDPKETIYRGTNRYDSSVGRGWFPKNYLNYLMDNNEIIKNKGFKKIKAFYAEEYVEYLEKNNFFGLELKTK